MPDPSPDAQTEAMALRFWSAEERVEQFAERDTDKRLEELATRFARPTHTLVLDLGCAGGRNTEFLARRHFDFVAVDFAPAMVERTRRRLVPIVGREEAERRVRQGRMSSLPFLDDASIDLVLGLGIYQQAQSEEEWAQALSETSRVLKVGGLCLVANFGPRTGPVDSPPEKIPGTRFSYGGMAYGNACLLPQDELDEEFRRFALYPEVPSKTVEKEAEGRIRQTVNALYRKEG